MEAPIPLFNTTVDLTDPNDVGRKVGGAVAGAVVGIVAIGGAQYVVNRGRSVAGVDEDDSIEVV